MGTDASYSDPPFWSRGSRSTRPAKKSSPSFVSLLHNDIHTFRQILCICPPNTQRLMMLLHTSCAHAASCCLLLPPPANDGGRSAGTWNTPEGLIRLGLPWSLWTGDFAMCGTCVPKHTTFMSSVAASKSRPGSMLQVMPCKSPQRDPGARVSTPCELNNCTPNLPFNFPLLRTSRADGRGVWAPLDPLHLKKASPASWELSFATPEYVPLHTQPGKTS